MSFWAHTITLYNRHEDSTEGTVKYYRHVLHNCFVKRTNNQVTVGNTHIQSDDTIVRIPSQPDFLPIFEWKKADDGTKAKFITLQADDLIIFGAVADDIDEYTSGKRKNDIIEKYKDLGYMSVKSFNLNTFLPTKHYYVRGI